MCTKTQSVVEAFETIELKITKNGNLTILHGYTVEGCESFKAMMNRLFSRFMQTMFAHINLDDEDNVIFNLRSMLIMEGMKHGFQPESMFN